MIGNAGTAPGAPPCPEFALFNVLHGSMYKTTKTGRETLCRIQLDSLLRYMLPCNHDERHTTTGRRPERTKQNEKILYQFPPEHRMRYYKML